MDGTADLIDLVLTQVHKIDSSKVAAAAVTAMRARILNNVKRAGTRLWYLRDWRWRHVDTEAVTRSLGAFTASLPANWANNGQQGGVWRVADDTPVLWRRLGVIKQLQAERPDETGPMQFYSVEGLQTLTGWPKAAAAETLRVSYLKGLPTFTDASPDGGIEELPEDWHLAALYEGVALLEMVDKGTDKLTLQIQQAVYDSAKNDLIESQEDGTEAPHDFPRFSGSDLGDGGDGYGYL